MERDAPFPCEQEPTTSLYTERDESNPQPPFLFP
jgi:hypothetical protein